MKYFLIYLIIANLLALACFGMDKYRAKTKKWRIPEKHLFFFALIGGGFGAWCGMYLFRHKTRHWYFVLLIPAITLIEYALLTWWLLR